MAGDQGSDPSQSGGSYSEEPNIFKMNDLNQKQYGILRSSQDNATILRRGTNVCPTVSFQNRIKRAYTIAEKNTSKQKSNNQSNLSIMSKGNSDAGNSVMTKTGETPIYLTEKLPIKQHYSNLESIEIQ